MRRAPLSGASASISVVEFISLRALNPICVAKYRFFAFFFPYICIYGIFFVTLLPNLCVRLRNSCATRMQAWVGALRYLSISEPTLRCNWSGSITTMAG